MPVVDGEQPFGPEDGNLEYIHPQFGTPITVPLVAPLLLERSGLPSTSDAQSALGIGAVTNRLHGSGCRDRTRNS